MTLTRWLLVALLGLGSCSVLASESPDAEAVEQRQRENLAEAKSLLKTGETEPAIAILDRIIEHYAAAYPQGESHWYVARGQGETLAYLLSAAAQHDRGTAVAKSSQVLYVSWADALYHKGYALVEQRKITEAGAVLQQAIRLSPYNSMYLSESGHIHQIARDWEAALGAFKSAEDAVAFSPESLRKSDASRAKRGIAYSLIELGRLDEAGLKLEDALELDPEDQSARESLEYVKHAKSGATGDPAAE